MTPANEQPVQSGGSLGGELRYSFRLTSNYPRLVIGNRVMG